MAAISKVDLLKKRFGVEDVEIPGVGTVQVRPLSRSEALALQGVEMDVATVERKLLALALVSPQLTEGDVAEWQESSPAGELEPVVRAITRLSGMEQSAVKEAVKQFRS